MKHSIQALPLILVCWVSAAAAEATKPLALDQISVVDSGQGVITEARCVRIERDHIVAVTAAGSEQCLDDARVLNLDGHYLMPGLIDTHAHLTLGPLEIQRERGRMTMSAAADDDIADHNAKRLVAHGVTTIRNPGGDLQAAKRYQQRLSRGDVIGPESFDAGMILHNAEIRNLTAVVHNTEDINQAVAAQAAQGAEWIKLYTGLSPELLQAGIDAAHEHGLPAVAHLDHIAWPDALAMGLDSIVHLMPISPDLLDEASRQAWQATARPGTFAFFEWWEHFDPDGPEADQLIESFNTHRPIFDATLVAFHAAFVQDQDNHYKRNTRRLAHPRLRANWEDWFTFAVGWKAEDFERARAIWPKVQRLAKRVYTSRACVTIGTDMSNPWIAPGSSMHSEMSLLAEAGISHQIILAAATVNAAKALGAGDRLGRVRPGYEADLIVLKANPLADISNAQAIAAVLLNGRWLDASHLSKLTATGES